MERFFVSSELSGSENPIIGGSENAIAARRMGWEKETPVFFLFLFFFLARVL